jgi:hypothetical protein
MRSGLRLVSGSEGFQQRVHPLYRVDEDVFYILYKMFPNEEGEGNGLL